MTDRHAAYTVTLEFPIREDAAEATIAAIMQIKGVIDVRPVVDGHDQFAGEMRRDHQWRAALDKLIRNGPQKEPHHD